MLAVEWIATLRAAPSPRPGAGRRALSPGRALACLHDDDVRHAQFRRAVTGPIADVAALEELRSWLLKQPIWVSRD